MDRLISEQAVLEAFREYQGSISDFYKAVKTIPSADIDTLIDGADAVGYRRGYKEAQLAIPSAEPTDVDEALRILDAINSSGRLDYSDYCELHDAISMISSDKDEWVKRSDVLRIIDKRVNETLAEPYKGMTNGEVIKAVFPDIPRTLEWHIQNVTDDDWWNSPYESQESEEI